MHVPKYNHTVNEKRLQKTVAPGNGCYQYNKEMGKHTTRAGEQSAVFGKMQHALGVLVAIVVLALSVEAQDGCNTLLVDNHDNTKCESGWSEWTQCPTADGTHQDRVENLQQQLDDRQCKVECDCALNPCTNH